MPVIAGDIEPNNNETQMIRYILPFAVAGLALCVAFVDFHRSPRHLTLKEDGIEVVNARITGDVTTFGSRVIYTDLATKQTVRVRLAENRRYELRIEDETQTETP